MIVEKKYKKLWEKAHELGKTSSILDVEDGTLTFARTDEHLKYLEKTDKLVHVVVPNNISMSSIERLPKNIVVHILNPEDDIQYVFTYLHNDVNKDRDPKTNFIGKRVNIHPKAIIGVHGNTYCTGPDGNRINFKHMGNVVIGNDVDVEALSIVHRAGMGSTIIRDGAKICVKCNIGHNCTVGERTIVAPGVLLGGGSVIGSDCYIWQGVIIRGHISICDRVIIGAGSIVLKNITDSGVYFGSPAKYIKPYEPSLR